MKKDDQKKEQQEWLDKEPKYPQRAAASSDETLPCEGVYAGPVMAPIAMMTYAGPQMMNGFPGPAAAGAFLTMQQAMEAARQEQEPAKQTENLICGHCGCSNSASSKYCSRCGNRLEQPETKQCSRCGAINAPGSKFCMECGSLLDDSSQNGQRS